MTVQTFLDRSGWRVGPWNGEPDRISWRDAATGLPCLMVRNPSGCWCGYVAVPPGHPAHGRQYEQVHTLFSEVSVHGGLTYSAECQEDKEYGICHQPAPGEPEDVWWLGFDTAHGGDIVPEWAKDLCFRGAVYRDVFYVRDQVSRLARQLAAIAAPPC